MSSDWEIVLAVFLPPSAISWLREWQEELTFVLVTTGEDDTDNLTEKLVRMPGLILLGEEWIAAREPLAMERIRMELAAGEIPIIVLGHPETEPSRHCVFAQAGLEYLPGYLWPDLLLPRLRHHLLRQSLAPPPVHPSDASNRKRLRQAIHDLNNLLAVISGASEVIATLAPANAPYAGELHTLLVACGTARQQTQTLHDLLTGAHQAGTNPV
ncbi:MAG: hypothetical protein HQM03_15390 [Magnetococcales bacterium]|nr:hypothetical protein [Magnetococcales bacterium]